jgi:hypothetical protein
LKKTVRSRKRTYWATGISLFGWGKNGFSWFFSGKPPRREGIKMAKIECCWYIGESLLPWEASVAGTLARALIRSGTVLHAYSGSGTDLLNIPGLLSWRSMHTIERAAAAGTRGRLWHLWGTPPFWWGLVRLRARTVHTRFSLKTEWKGHPTVFSATECSGGETYIPPAFEVKVNWGGEGPGETSPGDESLLCLLAGETSGENDYSSLLGSMGADFRLLGRASEETMQLLSLGRTMLLIENPVPSLALLSANGALMGVPTAAPRSPVMDELLGKEGYVYLDPFAGADEKRWVLTRLAGEEGRAASAAARRHVSEQFTPEKGAKKLENLYISLSGGDAR